MKYSINEIRRKLIPVAEKYGVEQVYLFGSYARLEAGEKSDIDLLIKKGKIQDLLDYFGFVSDLENSFGIHVDVVTTTSNDYEFLENIKREAILLYDQTGQDSYTENFAVL